MVIVLMGPGAAGTTTTVGKTLAERLGWAFVAPDRAHSVDLLRATVARAAERREPLVLVCPGTLSADDRERVAGTMRPVRFVVLGTGHGTVDDRVLALNASADVDTIIGHIRLEFGV